jgi:hypothetical protein
MNLNELAVGVSDALLEDGRLCRAGANHGVGALAEDGPDATRRQNNCIRRERTQLHGAQVEGGDAAGDALGIDHRGEKLPALVLLHLAFGFVAADLLVERVEQLLPGRCAGKGGAVVERAAEAAKVQQPLGSAIEGHAHAIQQIDNRRGGLAHGLHRRLVGQKVAAVNGVVEVLVSGVALAFEIFRGVDAALRAHRVRTLDRNDGKQIDAYRRPRQS